MGFEPLVLSTLSRRLLSAGLDLDDDPDAGHFIGQVAEGLQARVPDKGVAGIELPVRVVVG